MFPFFEHYLKDAPDPNLPGTLAFDTGTNEWLRYATWPPAAQPTSLYLRADGRLSFDPPTAQEAAYDQYVSDPANPVPYVEHPSSDLDEDYMYGDQSFASRRADVLTYRTDPLPANLAVTGPLSVRMHISSSGTDSDFIVKFIDEDSSGRQLLIRGEPMRAKFRKSFSSPEPLQPNQPTALDYEMPDVNHTFLPGHHIVVQVQSSWFPLNELNPQRFIRIPDATSADFQRATQRVFHQPGVASSLILHVLKAN